MNKAILIFGYPGAGKKTQGKILSKLPGFHHISLGDLFRAITPVHPQFDQVDQNISKGDLVPDDLVILHFL